MKRFFCVFGSLLALLGTSGCEQEKADNTVTVFDKELAAAHEDKQDTLSSSRPAIEFEDGFVADTCNAYLEHRNIDSISETVDNQLIKSEYLSCEFVGLMGTHEINYAPPPKDHVIAARLESALDLTAFPSSLAQMVDEEHRYPASLESMEFEIKPLAGGIRLSRDQQSLSITVVAEGDIDDDGATDWVVMLSDEILDGTYRDYGIGVISDIDAESPLVLERF